MQWIKTVEDRFINLNLFKEFKAYNLEDADDNFYGIKLTAIDENDDGTIISYFNDIEECIEFVNKFTSNPASLCNYLHTELHDLINYPDEKEFSWKEKAPEWSGKSEDWDEYYKKNLKFMASLNIKENECSFCN